MFKRKTNLKKAAGISACAALGFALGYSEIAGFSAPLAAVLPAALSLPYSAAALCGTVLSCALRFRPELLPIAVSAGTAIFCGIRSKGRGKRADLTLSAGVSAAYLMSAAALSTFSGGGAAELFRLFVFAAALFVSEYIFSRSSAELRLSRSVKKSRALFCCGFAVCALCPVSFGPISLGGVAAAFAVMFSASRFGAGYSSAVAAACALGAGISNPAQFADFALLCIPAAVCGGIFAGSPLWVSVFSPAILLPSAILLSGDDGGIALALDCAIASVLTTALYRPILKLSFLYGFKEAALKTGSAETMSFAVKKISERLLSLAEKPGLGPRPLSDAVYSKLCINCPNNSDCFDFKGAHDLLPRLDSIVGPPDLAEVCGALPFCSRAAEAERISLEAYKRGEYISLKAAEREKMMRLCASALSSLAGAMEDLGKKSERRADIPASRRFSKYLDRFGIAHKSCAVYENGEAEAVIPARAAVNESKAALALTEAVPAEYCRPERFELEKEVVLKFIPEPRYTVEAGACQLSATEDVSGDVAESFTVGRFSYVLLSDGMGVGGTARAASLFLTGILKELISAGYSVETAIRLGSAIMSSSMPEESFATLDLLKVDRATGAAEIYKAGGCQSFLFREGGRTALSSGGYPLGILNPCELKIHRFFAGGFSALIMMTDGAQDLDGEICESAMTDCGGLPSGELAASLLRRSGAQNLSRRDDISVTVVKIERRMA